MSGEQPDPSLSLDSYAFALEQGLSEETWRIWSAGEEVLTAHRPPDRVRSVYTLAVLGYALLGAALFLLGTRLGGATPAIVLACLMCMAIVLALAPILGLRRRKPIVFRRAHDGPPVLEVHTRSRFPIARVVYDVRLPDGPRIGRLTHRPIVEAIRTAWRIDADGDSRLVLAESLSAGAQRRLGQGLVLAAGAVAALAKVLRIPFLGKAVRERTLRRFDLRRPSMAAQVGECLDDPRTDDWVWLAINPGHPIGPEARASVLAACLLTTREDPY